MYVRFSCAEVPAFHGVVKQAIDGISVVLIIFSGVDSALSRYTVRSARTVLKAERFDVVAEFRKSGRRGSSRQAGTDYDDVEFSFVGRVD